MERGAVQGLKTGMEELDGEGLEKFHLLFYLQHDKEEHLSHRISRRNKAAVDSTLLLHHKIFLH